MKQVIVVREDLDLSRGKTAAQAAHASLGAYRKVGKDVKRSWEKKGEKKVVVGVEDEEGLLEVKRNAENRNLPTYLVKDAGRTEISKGTTTSLAVGPAENDKIDKVTGHLSLIG